MSERLTVVTGSNRGLGLPCARAFAGARDKVALRHRRGAPDRLYGVVCDSTATSEARQHGLVEVPVAIVGEAL
ncbi:NAD(P)-dependent dehydrogenase (short-subunit alcohol dehydrogenase family) [Actinokineospora baliensis]|uniref:hypothetical protein n=1 Tax=Actinokineospora baliensis TaxID=547056 RepID=UPI00195BE049|nr:NAD(P)-dependent dehydrogenase (short-subunit alcohol dehydrogenase family) [Actinokineospora baliensis]